MTKSGSLQAIIGAVVLQCAFHGSASAQLTNQVVPAAALPPVEKFFSRARYSEVTLSPDGKFLVAAVPFDGHRNLALIDIDKGTLKMLTTLPNQDVAGYTWLGDRMIELTAGDTTDASGLNRIKQRVIIDLSGNVVRNMFPANRRPIGTVIARLNDAGDDLIIASIERTVDSLDAYRFNPTTNQRELLTLSTPGDVSRLIADRQGNVRVAFSDRKDGTRRRVFYRKTNADAWKMLRDDPIEATTLTPLAFSHDGQTMYAAVPSRDGSGRRAIHVYDAEHDQLGEKLYESGSMDATSLVFDDVESKLVGVRDDSRGGVTWIDPQWKLLQESIDAVMPNTHNYFGWARHDPSRVLVTTLSDTQPPIFFLLDRKTHKLEQVAAAYPDLDEKDLSPRYLVHYKARDGLSIPAYLTMPRRPDGKKPPLIIDIHGGPFAPGYFYGFNAEAQFLASRGYAVLQPNFRGTIGYGAAFEQAGWKQWGLSMQDDLTDGAKWLVDTDKVDGDRICLMGGSYGGYATLWGLEKEPQLFRCGVAFVAVSDFDLLFDVNWSDTNRADRYGAVTNFDKRSIGDPDKDREKLRETSPLYHADRIQAPLLLAYGAADVRVPLIHGNRMRSALDKYNKSYEWVVYSDEGHGFNKDENKFDFYRRVDAFLAKNLTARPAAGKTASADTGAAPAPR